LAALVACALTPIKEVHCLLLAQKYAASYMFDGSTIPKRVPMGVTGVKE
jgi:hypothetical protein